MQNIKMKIRKISNLVLMLILCMSACSSEKQKEEGPDYLTAIEKYADSMIGQGRDHYGKEHSPLFASALNRENLGLVEKQNYTKIDGVRVKDRSLSGANMIDDIDLFRLLYELTVETGNTKYTNAADSAIQYFFNNCQSATTGLMAWGEHLYWDFYEEDCAYAPDFDFHEAKQWPFFDRSYILAPGPFWRFVLCEWDHQIHDKATGDFSRHARYTRHETYSGFEFPRYAGQMIERWADAYNRPENQSHPRRDELLTAIKVVFQRMLDNVEFSEAGYLVAGSSSHGDHNEVVWLTNNLELARCLESAAPTMDEEFANKMVEFALKQDIDFVDAPHKLDSTGGGFAVTLHAQTGLPRTRSMNKPYTSTWSTGYGYGTHAGAANTCFSRYQSLKDKRPGIANKYQDLIIQSAEKYLKSTPDTTQLLKPKEFADVIKLMLNCHELTSDDQYIVRASFFADMGIGLFLDDNQVLPKATNKNAHYESITGGPSFMLQLLKLHETLSDV